MSVVHIYNNFKSKVNDNLLGIEWCSGDSRSYRVTMEQKVKSDNDFLLNIGLKCF